MRKLILCLGHFATLEFTTYLVLFVPGILAPVKWFFGTFDNKVGIYVHKSLVIIL